MMMPFFLSVFDRSTAEKEVNQKTGKDFFLRGVFVIFIEIVKF